MRDRNTIPLPSLVVLALVPVVLLGGVWGLASANEAPPTTTTTTTLPPPPADEMATDLLSYRRHPEPIADLVAERESAEQFDTEASRLTSRLTEGMCLTIRRGDEVIVDVAGDVPLVPASNQKLLVAAVALDVLGPDYRFRTELRSTPPVGGVVPGDVYLVGGGDPLLVTAGFVDPKKYPGFNTTTLDGLVDQLVTVGVTSIEGDVVGDATRYDDEFEAATWGDDITNDDAGPYDALLVNDGLIDEGTYAIVPAQAAANTMYDLIIARGITVGGGPRQAGSPTDAAFTTLALIESAPLADIVVEMLHTSDNNTAEMLLKEIGLQAGGAGSRAAGAAVVAATLNEWGLASAGATVDDGSGLSRANRVTCRTLSGILATSPVADLLATLLPVAGRDGTLADQLVDTPADGELVAKTGTLTGVKALTGVMDGADDEPVEFALVLNVEGANGQIVYAAYWNDVVDLISRYPMRVEPDTELFAPR